MLKSACVPERLGLSGWVEGQSAAEDLAALVESIADCCVQIAWQLRQAPLAGNIGVHGTTNSHGEPQKSLDIIANTIMLKDLELHPCVGVLVSEECEHAVPVAPNGRYAVCFDPLDGSSNIETNAPVGTIFSVLDLGDTTPGAVLERSRHQVAAGYAIYGASAQLVLTLSGHVARFVLDEAAGFILVDDCVRIPKASSEFAINTAHAHHWDRPTSTYVAECVAGGTGPRARAFNMRWVGSMVADLHRIFIRGGIFIYPALNLPGAQSGKLRFLYEVNPLALLVERAGGEAICGAMRALEVEPAAIHQKVPVALGSSEEVAYMAGLAGRLS